MLFLQSSPKRNLLMIRLDSLPTLRGTRCCTKCGIGVLNGIIIAITTKKLRVMPIKHCRIIDMTLWVNLIALTFWQSSMFAWENWPLQLLMARNVWMWLSKKMMLRISLLVLTLWLEFILRQIALTKRKAIIGKGENMQKKQATKLGWQSFWGWLQRYLTRRKIIYCRWNMLVRLIALILLSSASRRWLSVFPKLLWHLLVLTAKKRLKPLTAKPLPLFALWAMCSRLPSTLIN